jgi:glucose-1-phosphate cytidylyltransferase
VKAVILAGGYGTRLSEETQARPKPMVEIGGQPILWHIMKGYAAHGIMDFVVCCGYRGYVIKEYFANFLLHQSDVAFDLAANEVTILRERSEPWRVTLVDTGIDTMTGGRLGRIGSFLDPGEAFCMTYGDGLSDVDIRATVEFHRQHGRAATVTAVKPPGRFGALALDGDRVTGFTEKPAGDRGLINGGFFVLETSCLDLIDGDSTRWEDAPLERLAANDELRAFEHGGFWHPMDTLRDRNHLDSLWDSGAAPWKVW